MNPATRIDPAAARGHHQRVRERFLEPTRYKETVPAHWRNVESRSPPVKIDLLGIEPERTSQGFGLIHPRSTVRLPIPTSSTVEKRLHKVISGQLDLSDFVMLTEEEPGRQLLELWSGDAPRGTITLRDGQDPLIGWEPTTPDAVQGRVWLSPRNLGSPPVFMNYDCGAMEGLLAGWRGHGGTTAAPELQTLTAELSQQSEPGNRILYRVSEPVTVDLMLVGLLAMILRQAYLELPMPDAIARGMVANTGEATFSPTFDPVFGGAPVPARLEEVVGWDRLQPEAA